MNRDWWSVRVSKKPDKEYDCVAWGSELQAKMDAKRHEENHGLTATYVQSDERPDAEEVLEG